MHIKGRHVTQNIAGIAPAHHDIQGIGKQMKLVSEVKPNGVIRIDDENHPEFWLEIQLSVEDLKTLLKENVGYYEGDECNRQCHGVIDCHPPEGCSCHISPPCSACMAPRNFCPECGWEESED